MIQKLSSPEQEKVTALFNKFGVEYMAVGDYAMRKYVEGRYFNNMQLWVKPTPENYKKVEEAFASVRRKLNVDEKTFTTEKPDSTLLKIGRGHKGVELVTGVAGLAAEDFNRIFADRKVLNAGDVPVPILNEKDLHKSLQKSSHVNQATDIQLLERSYPNLNQTKEKRVVPQVIDWKEAAKAIDPHKLLQDLGYTHIPSKGLFASSKSQTYQRGEERITVYPNPTTKPFFIDHSSGKKGDAIDLLNWHHNFEHKKVNAYIKEHFGGLAPVPLQKSETTTTVKKSTESSVVPIDEKAVAELHARQLREQYGLKKNLTNTDYLESRSLSLATIFRPEFFKQILTSLGWSSKEQKSVNIENTVFPMRNDHGLNSLIIRNQNFKGQSEGERRDAIWLSNPPMSLNKDIKIPVGDKPLLLPKGTEGTLIGMPDKPGHYQFYFIDPEKVKSGKEIPYNRVEVSGKALTQLTTALNPLKVDRLMITENPIDAMSFHQLSPPKAGETRMYISTGGQPSEKQVAYINQLVQRIAPAQVVLGNDNEKVGTKFNINMMGGIHHPAASNPFIARLHETKGLDGKSEGEYHLKIFAAKDPKEMEKIALKITDAINRQTPKGQQPPARVTFLNGSPEAGTEITIAFPKNDRFLQATQKSLEKLINEGAQEQQVMKVVKPQTKDFAEDLEETKKGRKITYDLGEIPSTVKTQAKNLLHQVSAYASNAFDALFGGIPGSLPRVEHYKEQSHHDTTQRMVAAKTDASKKMVPSSEEPVKKVVEVTKVDSKVDNLKKETDDLSKKVVKALDTSQKIPPSGEKSQPQEKKVQEKNKLEEKVEKKLEIEPMKQSKARMRI